MDTLIAAAAIAGFSIAALFFGFAVRTILTIFALLDTEYAYKEESEKK